jgi:hypothetical protein
LQAKVAEVDADAQKQKTQRKLDRTAPLVRPFRRGRAGRYLLRKSDLYPFVSAPQPILTQRATKKMLKEKEKLRQRKKKAPAAESKEAAPVEKKRRVAFA